jgi:hypothetical protein
MSNYPAGASWRGTRASWSRGLFRRRAVSRVIAVAAGMARILEWCWMVAILLAAIGYGACWAAWHGDKGPFERR